MSGFFRQAVNSTCKNCNFQVLSKRSCTTSKTTPPAAVKDVPGLSNKIVAAVGGEVGPGASKQSGYKNPEYFLYNNISYFEAEVEMLKYRLPQPSNRPVDKK